MIPVIERTTIEANAGNANSPAILVIVHNSAPAIEAELSENFIISRSMHIEDFVCSVDLRSIGVAPFPEITDDDTPADVWNKNLEVQRLHPSKIFEILEDPNGTGSWQWIGKKTLQTQGEVSYPNLMQFFTKDAAFRCAGSHRIGVRFLNSANGGLLTGADRVVFRYTKVHKIEIVRKPIEQINNSQSYAYELQDSPIVVLPQNNNRKAIFLTADITNPGPIWLGFGNSNMAQKGATAFLTPGGSFQYAMDVFHLPLAISAVGDSAAIHKLYAVEFM